VASALAIVMLPPDMEIFSNPFLHSDLRDCSSGTSSSQPAPQNCVFVSYRNCVGRGLLVSGNIGLPPVTEDAELYIFDDLEIDILNSAMLKTIFTDGDKFTLDSALSIDYLQYVANNRDQYVALQSSRWPAIGTIEGQAQ